MLQMLWHHKRQLNKSKASGERFQTDKSGRFPIQWSRFRLGLEEEKCKNGPYQFKKLRKLKIIFMKLFKLETILKDDRPSEWWIGIGQLALTIDELSSFTSLSGSSNDLSGEERG